MGNFRDLSVWAKAHALTLGIYKSTQKFPREEIFGLTAQMRRASNSIGANLAEGCGRKSDPEFRRFIHLAMGSASELEHHLLLARDLQFVTTVEFEKLKGQIEEIGKMLKSLSVKVSGKAAGYK
ncbi:MAG TPA: four helix bundle protein [Terriglobales bacterium]